MDLGKLKAGGSWVQNFALYVNLGETDSPWEDVLGMADFYEEELKKNEEAVAPAPNIGIADGRRRVRLRR